MDNKVEGFSGEHSDSDSGESWTLLDHMPSYGDEAPHSPNKCLIKDDDIIDKDEDTDGISIISDSEPESATPIEHYNYEILPEGEALITEESIEPYNITPEETLSENDGLDESDDLLGEAAAKNKTYVHRRDKKLSTVLNIIVLGSVITAAGVAVGHMWGVRDDCAQHSLSNINKILSKLYKIQEENVMLRNKIKELTLANTLQFQYKKDDFINPPAFKQKCRKVFEESLANKNAKTPKCVLYVDELGNPVNDIVDQNAIDLNKDKYLQNKSSLDVEQENVLKGEPLSFSKHNAKSNNVKKQRKSANEKRKQFAKYKESPVSNDDIINKIVSSADSIENENHNINKVEYRKEIKIKQKEHESKKQKGEFSKLKYKMHYKKKQEKVDKQTKHESKGDKDEIVDLKNKIDNKHLVLEDFVYIQKDTEESNKIKFDNWFEKRAILRMEARKNQRPFGDSNSAGWYFRRMHKREQCRSQPINLTNRKQFNIKSKIKENTN